MSPISRRRFLTISAAAAAVLIPGRAVTSGSAHTWRGVALGAEAGIHLDGLTPSEAAPVIDACLAELARLENQFSLYVPGSALSRLNRDGRLDTPDPVFLELLTRARTVHEATGGAFDPTVQTVWAAHAEHYAGDPDAPAAPQGSLSPVDFGQVSFSPAQVVFRQPGMAMTLNGIAQGFITDRIAALMKVLGLDHVLVSMGEIRALGHRRDGTAWPVRLAAPDDRSGDTIIHLDDRAVATSATLGTVFDRRGTVGHIIDPRSGEATRARRTVSVIAPSATLADGLSTAFCLMEPAAIATAAAAFEGVDILET